MSETNTALAPALKVTVTVVNARLTLNFTLLSETRRPSLARRTYFLIGGTRAEGRLWRRATARAWGEATPSRRSVDTRHCEQKCLAKALHPPWDQ